MSALLSSFVFSGTRRPVPWHWVCRARMVCLEPPNPVSLPGCLLTSVYSVFTACQTPPGSQWVPENQSPITLQDTTLGVHTDTCGS